MSEKTTETKTRYTITRRGKNGGQWEADEATLKEGISNGKVLPMDEVYDAETGLSSYAKNLSFSPAMKSKNQNIDPPRIKRITETKCICHSCQHVWYYGKKEEWGNLGTAFEDVANAGSDTATSCLTCGCCGGWQTDKKSKKIDLNKCPQCNSQNITKEKVIHEIKQ